MTPEEWPGRTDALAGQVALVTGPTSGLGRRFAIVLAAAGAAVGLAARREDRLAELVAEIEGHGGTCVAVPLDVADAAALPGAVDVVEEALGPVTILVNNAGIPDASYATRLPPDLVDRVLDVNLRAPFVLSCEVARRLIAARRSGRIVNIASMSAFTYVGEGAALYATTKGGLVRMTEALAVEWAKYGINVNAIAPGAFASEMMDGMLERVGDLTTMFARARMGAPHQLDTTLRYLVDPASEAVTGTVVKVDDGQGPR